jgi:hypothetical protein
MLSFFVVVKKLIFLKIPKLKYMEKNSRKKYRSYKRLAKYITQIFSSIKIIFLYSKLTFALIIVSTLKAKVKSQTNKKHVLIDHTPGKVACPFK